MRQVKLKWLVSTSNAGEVIDKSYWGDGNESLYTCARDILKSDFDDFPKWKRTTSDDLLLTRNGTPYIHVPVEGAIYSNVVQRISVPKVDKYYLRYALEDRVRSFRGYGVSIESLNYEMWSNLEVDLPDLPTQRAIADFLDRETARIDTLIEKKQRLVELLGEREDKYIRGLLSGETTHALSRKSTNAPWLNAVPDHWNVIPLRHLVKIQTGGRDTKDRVDEGDYPFFVRSMTVERINTFTFDEEAVLTSGDGAGVGNVFHHINCKFDLHQRMYAFTEFRRVSGTYFYHFLRTFFKLQMTQWSAKSTVDSVRMPFLKTLLVTVPPEKEQSLMIKEVETRAVRDKAVKEKTNSSIDRLKEYRSALITSAVTGQIDVTKWTNAGTTDRQLDAIEEEFGA